MEELSSPLSYLDVNDIEIVGQIGAGSFGSVHKGRYNAKDVAVKEIRFPKQDPGFSFQKYIDREISVLMNVQHSNMIQFVGVAKQEDSVLIVTELVNGCNLRKCIKDEGTPWDVRIKIALDVAQGMEYLHSKQIVFRDMKTKNVVVDKSCDPWRGVICDFGFARGINEKSGQRPRALTMCGTDAWMAPELILGEFYDEKVDVYSYGLVVYELITYKKIENAIKRTAQTAFDFDMAEALTHIPGDCPPDLEELFRRACSYASADRPSFSQIVLVLRENLRAMQPQWVVPDSKAQPEQTAPQDEDQSAQVQALLEKYLQNITDRVTNMERIIASSTSEQAIVQHKDYLQKITLLKKLLVTKEEQCVVPANLTKIDVLKFKIQKAVDQIKAELDYLLKQVSSKDRHVHLFVIGNAVRAAIKILNGQQS